MDLVIGGGPVVGIRSQQADGRRLPTTCDFDKTPIGSIVAGLLSWRCLTLGEIYSSFELRSVRYKRLKIVRKWWLWSWLMFATPVVVLVTATARLGNVDFQYRAAKWVSRWWSRGMLRVTGSTYEVEGLEHIQGRGPYIIMSNHRSLVDNRF